MAKALKAGDEFVPYVKESDMSGELMLTEWDSIADLRLNVEQHQVLGYLVNQVSLRRTSELTRIPVEQISNWLRYDADFVTALQRLQVNREAFIRSDLMGLQMKSVEVLAWFLTEDVNAIDERTDDYRYSEKMRIALLQEKRKVASQIVGSALSRSSIRQVRVTHAIQDQMDAETMKQLSDLVAPLQQNGDPFHVVSKADLDGSDDIVDGTATPAE